ncbi:MAG TPA: EpsI family protein [Vicinamibacterales bacterium]|jgi:EpsI family protein
MSRQRLLCVLVLLMATAAVGRAAVTPRSAPVPPNLSALPYVVGGWAGVDAPPLDAETTRILAADDLVNRTYRAADGIPIGLYVAYYAAQRPGVSIHSPLHCLPGTGWEALDVTERPLANDRPGTMRRVIVRKGQQLALVLYWYALHGRMISGEIMSKLTLLADGVRLHRNDAALVRIVVPIGASVSIADQQGLAFARDVAPEIAYSLK